MALTPEAGKLKWERNFPAWVDKCNEKHGGVYQYPSVERVKSVDGKWKVRIVCPEHGEFVQAPEKHAFGQGCPKCSGIGTDKLVNLRALYPSFPWPDSLDIKNTKDAIQLECEVHGLFVTTYNRLTTRHGRGVTAPCPKCSKEMAGASRRKSVKVWADQIERTYGGRVSVDPLSITTSAAKARFVCCDHGEFHSVLQDVVGGHGCPACGEMRRNDTLRSSFDDFVGAAKIVHGEVYEYPPSKYINTKTPVAITCKKHGVFFQRPNNHVTGAGCPTCSNRVSSGELGVYEWLESSGVAVVGRDRVQLDGMEIDIYLPEYRIGVEYCGLYWHGEHHKHSAYHKEKADLARSKGIKLVTIFEDEWLNASSKQKVMFRLLTLLGASKTYAARKLTCSRVTWGQAKAFLDLHHMQGAGAPAKVCYGLFDGLELKAVSTWGKSRFDAQAEWEMLRFSGAYSDRIAGGIGKMFKAFVREIDPISVVTYADLRWGSGEGYGKIGFTAQGETAPGYFWCKGVSRFSRYDFQKHKLAGVLRSFDPLMSETENCHRDGYWRVFDCGHSRWLWVKQKQKEAYENEQRDVLEPPAAIEGRGVAGDCDQ